MIFNSIEFIIFFAIFFCLYWYVFNNKLKAQNILIIIGSYIFYGWWDWRFLSLIIVSSLVDYIIGLKLMNLQNPKHRKAALFISLGVNIGSLGVFKYFNFFVGSMIDLLNTLNLNANIHLLKVVLPVGISFYTFQTLSYTIDVYKGKLKPTSDIFAFFAFVSFFPQLVAGPIERALNLLPQFYSNRKFDYTLASSGVKLILIGFYKKIVVADSIALLVNGVFSSPNEFTGIPMITAIIFFAFQIYCDFSGYSDIAIGTSRLLGFNLITNFNTPYFSKSLSEFWSRWHISLSTWFRDYVYIPLGGNKVSSARLNFNIFVTFVVSGLWHGANWTFVVWGAIHGIFLILEKYIVKCKSKFVDSTTSFPSILTIPSTFIIVCFAWVFFRSDSLDAAFFILNNMFSDIGTIFSFTGLKSIPLKFRGLGVSQNDFITSLFFLFSLVTVEFINKNQLSNGIIIKQKFLKWSFYYALLISIIFWGGGNHAANFIYFQF
jgi:alginate O-acetyltransferase complex protein AlgI